MPIKNVENDLYINFFNHAYNFLLERTNRVITEEEIKQTYLKPIELASKDISMKKIYRNMLFSAQNKQRRSNNTIGGKIGGFDNLSKVLGNFDHNYVLEHFTDYMQIIDEVRENLPLKAPIVISENDPNKSLWPQFSNTCVSAARFLTNFKDAKDFICWAETFQKDERSIEGLPLILSAEIYGFGFPLACDFLKELGFENYGKPDVHIKDIFRAYKFIDELDSKTNTNESNCRVFKKMLEISKSIGISCYTLDKVIWLIGSGDFYLNENIRKISMKKDFMAMADRFLAQ